MLSFILVNAPAPALQLLVTCAYLGGFGNASTQMRISHIFCISSGSVYNYIHTTLTAILNLKPAALQWPNEGERLEIAKRIEQKFLFKNCIGLVDGVYLDLEYKPSHNGEDYYTRKGHYSLRGLFFVMTCAEFVISHLVGLGPYTIIVYGPLARFIKTRIFFSTGTSTY